MKINKLQQPSRTETSYDEVKMDLLVPPGGKTKNLYVRVYIPTQLREFFGGRLELRKSTYTSDPMLAKYRASVFVLQCQKEFLAAREQLKEYVEQQPHAVVLDAPLIHKIASVRFANLVKFDDVERDEMDASAQWDEHDELIGLSLDELKKIVARRKQAEGYRSYADSVCEFASVMGYGVDLHDPMLPALVETMAKAEMRAYQIMARRSEGDSAQPEAGELGPWLSDLLKDWETGHVSNLPTKTRSAYKSRIQDFIDFTRDKLVASVTRKDVWDWLHKRLHDDKRAEKTIKDGYLPALRSLFDYAMNSGQRLNKEGNPVQGVRAPRLDKREAAKREKPRKTFNSIYIRKIFQSAWYAGKSKPVGQLRSKAVTEGNARYWVPLIACCHGLRAEEICQLTLVDVGVQSGVMSIHVTSESGSVKNEESERWVPVHQVLLDLGFAQYVEFQRRQQAIPPIADWFVEHAPGEQFKRPNNVGALFPELHTTLERRSTTFLKRFNGFLSEELGFESGYTFHSFRHHWEENLRKVMVADGSNGRPWPEGMAERLSGRAKEQLTNVEGSSAGYGRQLPPRDMKIYLDKLSFSHLSWPAAWDEFQRN